MSAPLPTLRSRRPLAAIGGAALLLAAGWLAGTAGPSSAASLDDCLLPDLCPTLPGLPPTPGLPTTPTVPTVTDPPAADQPSSTGSAAEAADSSGSTSGAPQGSFGYKLVQVSARSTGTGRRIELRLSLSQTATIVTVLHRRTVPLLVSVRVGRPGANNFAVAVPRRVRGGIYGLQLRLATPAGTKMLSRRIAIPR